MSQEILVIGGGAAGFFTAINIKEKHPSYKVTILEKTSNTLSKVKVSGGGRCNVTNARTEPGALIKYYPRGSKRLYKPFERFSTANMRQWLEKRGVQTKSEDDQRVFPITNDSQTIINCFENEINRLGILINHQCAVKKIEKKKRWHVYTDHQEFKSDQIVYATGASPSSWKILSELGLEITNIVPSLFTFNIDDPRIKDLPGTVFPNAKVRISGTKMQEEGPVLITHWGLSGPAILKLSALCAHLLAKKKYAFLIQLNLSQQSAESLAKIFDELKASSPKKKLKNHKIDGIPNRYWEHLLNMLNGSEILWGQMNKRLQNQLIEQLTQATFSVTGKSPFKEEFVTAGGVDLKEINFNTMETIRFPGLFLAGEVLDIDALTGGFNFQACWTEGWIISESI